MANNASLGAAKNAKNDEFYTQYSDIEAEMNAYVEFDPDVFRGKTILLPCDDPEWSNFTKYFASNFERFGLKKLISTSYAKGAANKQLSFFEMSSPLYDEELHETHGKLFTLTHDTDRSGGIDTDDIEFSGYLEGDGDFRSAEVCRLRDEADIIITNPPFSMFREFLAWILDSKKQFIIIGSKNAITYKEVFPHLKDNKFWLGPGFPGGNAFFRIAPEIAREFANGVYDEATGLVKFGNVGWFTNIDHCDHHEELQLDTMAHNLKFNKKLKKKFAEEYGTNEYPHYDNYDAIEVPFTECIPSDYVPCWFHCPKAQHCEWAAKKGIDGEASALCESACTGGMGVPITFLDKHDPEQFEIIGADYELAKPELLENGKTGTGRFYCKKKRFAVALCADRHTPQDVTESWEFQSLSSINSTPNNLKSSDLPPEISGGSPECTHRPGKTDLTSAESFDTDVYLSARKCSGIMGVPITFFDKHNPKQFEIIGMAKRGAGDPALKTHVYTKDEYPNYSDMNATPTVKVDGMLKNTFPRILIRRKKGANE